MIAISPRSRGTNPADQFFRGKDEFGREPGFFFLTSSVLILWIFAKSIQNAADLGQKFGFPGGVAYAVYWISFLVAGTVLYGLRRRGYRSIHDFLESRYGTGAVWIFSLILIIRFWNEIWSNTIVMAQFFGPWESSEYYVASWAITALVLSYILKGGLRSSIITDATFIPLSYDYERFAYEMRAERIAEPFVETVETGWWTTCLEILPAKERAKGRY